MTENIFADEWIECLEAHYSHVIRTKDRVTEPSLTIVMHSAGFSDKQLAELRVRATMHVDDAGTDFVPDLNVLDEHVHDHSHSHNHAPVHEAQPVAPEAAEPQIFNIPIDLPPATPQPIMEAMLDVVDDAPEVPEPELLEVSFAMSEAISEEVVEDMLPADDMPESELEPITLESVVTSEALTEAELEADTVDEDDAPVEPEAKEPDPDAPQQLSLF